MLSIREVIDSISLGISTIKKATIWALEAAFMEVVIASLAGLHMNQMMAYGLKNMREALAKRILSCDYTSLNSMGTGEISSRIQEDMKTTTQFLKEFLKDILYGVIQLSLAISFALWIDWGMALISILLVPATLSISMICSKWMGKSVKDNREAAGKFNQFIQEFIWQIPIIKAFVAEKRWEEQIYANTDRFFHWGQKQLQTEMFFEPVIQLVNLLSQLCLLTFGGVLMLKGHLTPGELMIFTILQGYITKGLSNIPRWVGKYRVATISAQRMVELLELRELFWEKVSPINGALAVFFDRVNFSYGINRFKIENICLNLTKKRRMAIVGESGSGKSTLLKLIAGLCKPSGGFAYVLNYDLTRCAPEQIFCQSAIIFQETFLFPGTIYENLVIGNSKLNSEDVINACKAARIYDWIQNLPDGLETELSEFSTNISGGQKQRLGLARAILRKAPLWLLDEPTSALDAETGKQFMQELEILTKECTTILVTHQIQHIMDYDTIVYMENGRILGVGTHSQLLEKSKSYRLMFERQML